MASPLTNRQIQLQAQLRNRVVAATGRIWNALPGYDRENVDEWLSRVLPLVEAGQRQSAALTDAYLAAFLGRQALGIDPERVTGAGARNGTPPEAVYERPFVTVWTALGNGAVFTDAVNAGLARATGSAAMDVQMAMRATANAVQAESEGIFGFQRVADAGACTFCSEIDGAYVKFADAFPLHNNCGCGLEPLTAPHSRAATLPSGVAVHRHGELGSVITDAAHDFTGPSAVQ